MTLLNAHVKEMGQ